MKFHVYVELRFMKPIRQALVFVAPQGVTYISTKGVNVFTFENSGN
jgi:hypothetical protein